MPKIIFSKKEFQTQDFESYFGPNFVFRGLPQGVLAKFFFVGQPWWTTFLLSPPSTSIKKVTMPLIRKTKYLYFNINFILLAVLGNFLYSRNKELYKQKRIVQFFYLINLKMYGSFNQCKAKLFSLVCHQRRLGH